MRAPSKRGYIMHFARFSVALLATLALSGKALAFDGDDESAADAGDHTRSLYGWFGLDFDNWGPQLWLGASHTVTGPLSVASTLWVGLGTDGQHSLGEFGIGPELNINDAITITLQLGLGFDFAAHKLEYLGAPQLFITADLDPIYIEAWNFLYLYGPFYGAYNRPPGSIRPADTYVGRYTLLYELSDAVALGPQLELSVALNHAAANDLDTLTSMPVGLRVSLGYSPESTLGAFIAYETQGHASPGSRVFGRLSYVHSF